MKLHGQTVRPFSCTLIVNLIHILLLTVVFLRKVFRQTVVVFQILSHDPIALNLENFPFVPTEQPTKKKRREERETKSFSKHKMRKKKQHHQKMKKKKKQQRPKMKKKQN